MKTSLDSLFSEGSILAGSKRLRIGQENKTPYQMMQYLQQNPSALSASLHELAHFHSLISPLGVVLSARAAIRGHFLVRTVDNLRNGKDATVSLLKYVHSIFQLERLITAYAPLLEGIAVYYQTSFPCVNNDTLGRPQQILYEFAWLLFGLDPVQTSTPDGVTAKFKMDPWDFLNSCYEVLKNGPRFPFDGSDENLAWELEVGSTDRSLPYFLGHAYVRGIQSRAGEASDEYNCPDIFFNQILLPLLWSRRTGPKNYDLTSEVWPDLVYGWNRIFRSASNQRISAISKLPENSDILEWLLYENIDEKPTPATRIDNINDFLRMRLPDWDTLVEDEESLADSLSNMVMLTHLMNLCSEGECRIVAKKKSPDQELLYLLRVDNGTWMLRVDETSLQRLGVITSEIPLINDGQTIPEDGHLLSISAYITEGDFGLGKSFFPGGRPRHFLFWMAKKRKSSRGVLFIAQPEQSLKRAILVQVNKGEFQSIFRHRDRYLQLFETHPNLQIFIERIERDYNWVGLSKDMFANQEKHQVALARIDSLVTNCIITDLLGENGKNLTPTIVRNRLGNTLMDVRVARSIHTSSYGGPTQVTGPGQEDWLTVLRLINERSMATFGHPVFKINSGFVEYTGLWGSRAGYR